MDVHVQGQNHNSDELSMMYFEKIWGEMIAEGPVWLIIFSF